MINLKSSDYYTQRNNKRDPFSACMPTARVMFYIGNNIQYKNPSAESDDDYFMGILNTDEAKEFCYKKYPWAKGIPPNQIHGMYGSYLDPIVCGKRVTDFIQDLSFDDYMDMLKAGRVVMTSGAFQGRNGPIDGHAFCIVGFDNQGLLMADPYGDFHTNYADSKGYLVSMSKNDFVEHVKPLGSAKKWGHVMLIDKLEVMR